MNTTREAFALTAGAAQHLAGVVAARHRGDFDGANTLLAALDDTSRAAGGLLLADLAIALLAQCEGRSVAEVAGEVSLHLADLTATFDS